jgi:hypothetical protein
MKEVLFATLLFSGSLLLAQNAPDNSQQPATGSNGATTITGCVSRSNGDYVLMKQNPPVTYELQSTHKIRLKNYLGQRVEVTGTKSPTLSSSSDTSGREGSAAPLTITVTSIKALDKDCSESGVSR